MTDDEFQAIKDRYLTVGLMQEARKEGQEQVRQVIIEETNRLRGLQLKKADYPGLHYRIVTCERLLEDVETAITGDK